MRRLNAQLATSVSDISGIFVKLLQLDNFAICLPFKMDLKTFCQFLPKLELHAHLNGSLSPETLKTLYKLQNPDADDNRDLMMSVDNLSTLGECFKIFEIAHSLTTTPEAVFIATCDVVREFNEENVIYLELRSTPRNVPNQMTKEEYVQAIIRAFAASKRQCPNIVTKLLISVDRKQGLCSAEENIELAIRCIKEYPEYVVGIDLSGDPMVGDVFIDSLKRARNAGLRIAAHCAEVPNETETYDILSFKPDRLGHCTCVHPTLQGSQELFETLLASKIPVELCLTSNILCKTVPSYEAHQFKFLYDAGHPVTIATDDKGVFNASLSSELELVASTFQLGPDKIRKLCLSTIEYSFATAEEKEKLRAVFDKCIV